MKPPRPSVRPPRPLSPPVAAAGAKRRQASVRLLFIFGGAIVPRLVHAFAGAGVLARLGAVVAAIDERGRDALAAVRRAALESAEIFHHESCVRWKTLEAGMLWRGRFRRGARGAGRARIKTSGGNAGQ